jgi:Cytochrome P460
MRTLPLLALSLFLPIAIGQEGKPASKSAPTVPTGRDATAEPAYDSTGRLQPPFKYREWIYLTSGIDMSYNPKPEMDGMSMFDNVFVNPAAYKAFAATGTWPDKTMLVLESRGAEGPSSINKKGHSQGGIMGFEVHVRDEAKTPGGWAFYEFDSDKPAEQIPVAAACYSCHQQHAAVATTFVQFYPTLLPIAKQKKTLSAEYLKESAADQTK